jgi:hypothetical protein
MAKYGKARIKRGGREVGGARGRQSAAGEAYVRSENGVKFVPMS